MNNMYQLLRLVVYILLGSILGNCQRASYSFYPAQGGSVPVAEPIAVPPVAGVPVNGSTAGSSGKGLASVIRPRGLRKTANRRQSNAATARPKLATRKKRETGRIVWRKAQVNAPAPQEPERHRSKGIALVLAVLLGSFGAHRFYLGYYGAGTAYVGLSVLTVLFLTLGFLSLVFTSASYFGFLVVAFILSLLLQGWLIADIVRIITGNLKPKNGEYYPRFFQSSPNPDTPAEPSDK